MGLQLALQSTDVPHGRLSGSLPYRSICLLFTQSVFCFVYFKLQLVQLHGLLLELALQL